jgi:amino acid transporter
VKHRSAGARPEVGTSTTNGAIPASGLRVRNRERPIGQWAFAAVAVASLGGPLALAALVVPDVVGDASASAGLAVLAAVVVFGAPLTIWMRYSRYVSSSGGLYAFVEAAAGRRVALAQAGLWIVSYLLYVIYTTVQIVYDLLPAVVPGEHRYQSALALLIPIALAGVMIAGRRATLAVIAVIAGGQLLLAGVLDGVTVAHLSTPASTFGTGAGTGPLVKASAQTSLLYICASLPLFLGGELAAPARTIRRGLIGAYLITALLVLLAVAPLAAAPELTSTAVPGVSLVEQFAGRGLAQIIGVGVAVSLAGVILVEFLALTRIGHALVRARLRTVTIALGAVVVLAAPFSLINPQGFYNALIKPSLIALWLSQLIVFVVYPRFAARHRQPIVSAWVLTLVASGLAIYGLWITVNHPSS